MVCVVVWLCYGVCACCVRFVVALSLRALLHLLVACYVCWFACFLYVLRCAVCAFFVFFGLCCALVVDILLCVMLRVLWFLFL